MRARPRGRFFGGAGLLLTAALLVTTPGRGHASSGEERCIAAKARAVAAAVRADAECHARDVEAPGSAGPECFVDALAALPAAVAAADRERPCGGMPDYLDEQVGACIPFLQNTPNRCAGSKIRAGAALAVAKLRCLARAGGGAPDAACVARAERLYRREFLRAERRGPCPGTIDYIASNPELCVPLLAAAFHCGNGVIDPGEECDGQPVFCSRRGDCRIERDVACCFIGSLCADTYAEACREGGGGIGRGTCVGTPCDLFPGCISGSCQDPPVEPTEVCCERSGACQQATETTTFDLRDALVACVDGGGQPAIGGCGPDGHCAR